MEIPKPIRDRRRSVRVQESILFTIGQPSGQDIEALTLNISAHGAMCVVQNDVPVMTQLAITLPLPAGPSGAAKTVRLKGVIVRKEKDPIAARFRIAIFFSDIKPKDLSVLREFIDRRLKS